MANPAHRLLSYAEYLQLERETDIRHEFVDGEAWAMTGGTPRHSKIKTNLLGLLVAQLGTGPCQPYDSDLKVRVLATGLATYPDATVVCGDLELHPDDGNAVTNPALMVEVLSKSTSDWDRMGKFKHYRQIPSLRHYVLVGPGDPYVEHHARDADGTWRVSWLGPGDVLRIEGVGLELAVDDLYVGAAPASDDDMRVATRRI